MTRGIRWLALTSGVTLLSGCVSSKSSYFHTDPSGQHWYADKPVQGVPVTLEVPTHINLSLVKRYHYVTETVVENTKTTTTGTLLKAPGKDNKDTALVTYALESDFIKGKKIFLVDFKRPAAGTFKMGADIDKDTQYFTKLSHEVNDVTIDTVGKQVNDLVKTVIPALGRRTSNAQDAKGATAPPTIDSLVATTIIKLDDPQFEEKVREFLCCAANAAGLAQCGCDAPVGCGPSLAPPLAVPVSPVTLPAAPVALPPVTQSGFARPGNAR